MDEINKDSSPELTSMHEGVTGLAAQLHERAHLRVQIRALPDRRSAISRAPPAFDIKAANQLLQARIDEMDARLKLSAARLAPAYEEPLPQPEAIDAPRAHELGGVQI